MAVRGAGDVLGFREAFAETPDQASVQATEPSMICEVPKETFLVLLGLSVAGSALALDLTAKSQPISGSSGPVSTQSLTAYLSCDNGNWSNAYYQDDTGRYGNVFNFGTGALLGKLEFVHFGFGFSGPYNYDIELWDLGTCTLIGSIDNLVAGDAAGSPVQELVDLCPSALSVSGNVIVTIDANSCLVPNDCYPDVIYDDQVGVYCPYVVDAVGNVCYDVSNQSGPFVLRVETDNCPTPTRSQSWGTVKVLYR